MAATILDILRAEIAATPIARPAGRVVAVRGGRVELSGLSDVVALGDRVLFLDTPGQPAGEVIEIAGDASVVLLEGQPDGIARGQLAVHDGPVTLEPDDSWIGRVVTPNGDPLDGRPLQRGGKRRALVPPPRGGERMRAMGQRLETGLSLFNTMLPIVRGQRMGLFAGSGVGKSTLLARLAVGLSADVVVVSLVGERGRELWEFVETVLGTEGMRRAVVVAATADRSPLMRRRAAEAAMTVAEHFRAEGKHVLLLCDSITRFAEAHREIALTAGEGAAMRGYPPSMAARVMALAERAGPGREGEGDITAIFTVLVAGSEMEGPVADVLRGVLDGHAILDRQIAERGRFPAVDVVRSVSRSLPGAASEDENRLINDARAVLATYEASEVMVQAGLHTPGADPVLDRALALWPDLDAFFASSAPDGVKGSFERLRAILSRDRASGG